MALDAFDRALIAATQAGLPLVPRPFDAWAQALGRTPESVLHTLQQWLDQGTVRRIGAIVRHHELGYTANAMVVLLSYWLSYEYVRDPRNALEPERAGQALMRGAFHVLGLLLPYLEPASRDHLFQLAGHYQ